MTRFNRLRAKDLDIILRERDLLGQQWALTKFRRLQAKDLDIILMDRIDEASYGL